MSGVGWTVAQFAEYWDVSCKAVYDWIKAGQLEVLRPSRRTIRITQEQRDAFEARAKRTPVGANSPKGTKKA